MTGNPDSIMWDEAHRPDVSIAADAAIEYHADHASGLCCLCGMPIVAYFDGIGDDALDTRWHHVSADALIAALGTDR